MNLGALSVHFANREQLQSLRADPDVLLVEAPGRAENLEAFFDELSAALELPDYFGRNWDALEECLADLEPRGGLVLVVGDARRLWMHLGEEMALFADIWSGVAGDRGAMHLVFAV